MHRLANPTLTVIGWMAGIGAALARVLPAGRLTRQRVAFFLRANSNLYTSVRSRLIRFEYFDLLDPLPGHLARLNAPTPWSTRLMPHHRNMVRSLCEVRASSGRGLGGVLAVLQTPLAVESLSGRKGLSAAHRLEARSLAGTPPTTEQKIRGGDAEVRWITLLGGYDPALVSAAAVELGKGALVGTYRLSYCL